jgi:hypothetical protein
MAALWGLKLSIDTMNEKSNYLFVYCTFIPAENSSMPSHPMLKPCLTQFKNI